MEMRGERREERGGRTGHLKRWMPRRLPAGTAAETGRRAMDSISAAGRSVGRSTYPSLTSTSRWMRWDGNGVTIGGGEQMR
jgi:hypothetical protein